MVRKPRVAAKRESEGEAPPPSLCIECHKEIPAGARVCTECDSYQRRWKNELKYWGALTGVATLIVTGLSLSWGFLSDTWRQIFIRDLTATELDSHGQSTIWNQTDDRIWISGFSAKSTDPNYDLQWQLSEVVPTDEPAVFNLSEITPCQWHDDYGQRFDAAGIKTYVEQTTMPAIDLQDLKDDIETAKNNYVPVLLAKDGGEYRQLVGRPGGIVEIPFQCSFDYVRLWDGSKGKADVACVGVVASHDWTKPRATCPVEATGSLNVLPPGAPAPAATAATAVPPTTAPSATPSPTPSVP